MLTKIYVRKITVNVCQLYGDGRPSGHPSYKDDKYPDQQV